MATSGSKSVSFTSWDTLKFEWTRTSVSIANNTSTISWKMLLVAGSSGRISATSTCPWEVTVNGTTYSGSVNVGISNNATKTLASGTTTIKHNNDGSKTFNYSFNQYFGITFSGNWITDVGSSGSGKLDDIPRTSAFTVDKNGADMGTAVTFTIDRAATTLTHKLTYSFEGKTGTIGSDIATSKTWTIPISLASAIPDRTGGICTITCTTYSGTTAIGSVSLQIVLHVPSTVAPSVDSITISEAASGIADKFGVYVQSKSKLKVVIKASGVQGSTVKNYATKILGKTYNGETITSAEISSSGTVAVEVTVTDSRGHTSTSTKNVTVTPYTDPKITAFTAIRCNSDGTENDEGEHVKFTYRFAITTISDKNDKAHAIDYKATSDAEYTTLTSGNTYTADATYVTGALFDVDTSYQVRLAVTDYFKTVAYIIDVSTAFTLVDYHVCGKAMGIGKVSELEGVLDIGLETRFFGGIRHPILAQETDLNGVMTPNTYIGDNVGTYKYGNCPFTSGTFTLLVEGAGSAGQVRQRITRCHKTEGATYERFYYGDEWGEWVDSSAGDSGWIEPTLSSNFRAYEAANTPKYRKVGKVVEVRGIVTTSAAIGGSADLVTIFTLPTGYRPSSKVAVRCQGTDAGAWLLTVETNGAVTFSRNGDGMGMFPTYGTPWLAFQATFFID